MPAKADDIESWPASIFATAIMLAIGAWPALIWWPLAFLFPVICLTETLAGFWRGKRIAQARCNYSICDFARSFDYRNIDTWIIRATFEELSYSYPVRPDDRFAADLGVVGEDMDDSFEAIAKRIGRSADGEDIEANPLFNKKVETVRDLVMFLQHQPKLGHGGSGSYSRQKPEIRIQTVGSSNELRGDTV